MFVKKIIYFLVCLISLSAISPAFAILSLELTRGVAGAIPIAIVPFEGKESAPQDVSGVISNDLQNSGRFKVYSKQASGINYAAVGKLAAVGNDRYQVRIELLDLLRAQRQKAVDQVILSKTYTVSSRELRSLAHHMSDLIYQQITGVRGIFSTKLIYVLVQRTPALRYTLEMSDQDGYGPRPLLESREPIMSPAWSPDGRQVAYVSFEKKKAAIYLQNVASGGRYLLSEFPGINGAPAWSPDGRNLALVLSKGGSPNIYLMDIATRRLTQLTNDFYINTEPAFAPDGRSLLYTSNRGGNPQIYQINLNTGASSRVSYDGEYNARPSFTRDGRHIAMIHRVSGIYHIAILDLDSGKMQVLNGSLGDSSSPSIAPNGSMVLYDTVSKGRNMLGMASSDGRVQLILPPRQGEAQDPAWSPFLG
jgi:TolB protein